MITSTVLVHLLIVLSESLGSSPEHNASFKCTIQRVAQDLTVINIVN